MAETLKEKTAKGLLWGGLGNGGQQLLNALFGIILARRLSQADYGMVGMLIIFSTVANSLQEGGFTSAIIRKKEVSHADLNAVFWTCTLLSVVLYALLFISAPLIAWFYDVPELTSLSRYFFLMFVITSFGIAPRALLFRNMLMRENTIVVTTALLVSGTVAVIMAFCGFAYWGIATQSILYVTVVTALSYHYARWRPTLKWDFSPIRSIIRFSSKLIITNVFNIVNNNIFAVVLGKLYTPNVVGEYTQANKWNQMGHSFVTSMLGGIAQPVFAKTNDDIGRQKNIFRKLLRFTAFVSFPAMLGLSLVAEEFIVILLGAKWIGSAQMLRLLAVAGAFIPISTLFSSLLISRGHASTYMWSTITLCTAQIASLWLSAPYGIVRMIEVYVALTIAWLFVWHRLAHGDIHLGLLEMLADIMPYLLIVAVLVAAAHLLTQGVGNIYLRFAMKVVGVGTSYCALLWLLRSAIFREAVRFVLKKGQLE